MIFSLQKSYNMIPRKVVWHVPEKKHIHKQFIDVIKDVHDEAVISVRTIEGETNIFSITINYITGLLSEYLHALLLDDLKAHLVPWCMLLVDMLF